MSTPEYVICLECETPCYTFEWEDNELKDPICQACGNEDPEQFSSPDDFDALQGDAEEDKD